MRHLRHLRYLRHLRHLSVFMDMDPDHWDRDIREAFLTALADHLIEAAVTIQAVPVPEPDAAKPAVARAASG